MQSASLSAPNFQPAHVRKRFRPPAFGSSLYKTYPILATFLHRFSKKDESIMVLASATHSSCGNAAALAVCGFPIEEPLR